MRPDNISAVQRTEMKEPVMDYEIDMCPSMDTTLTHGRHLFSL